MHHYHLLLLLVLPSMTPGDSRDIGKNKCVRVHSIMVAKLRCPVSRTAFRYKKIEIGYTGLTEVAN